MKGKTFGMIIALFAVFVMASPAVAVGFATVSYSASTISASNTITAEYAIIEYYKFNSGTDYSLVTGHAFSHGCLQYNESGSGNNKRYTIAAINDLVVSIPNLNLKIDKTGSYSLFKNITVSGGNVTVSNFKLYINNTEIQDGTTIQGNTYYPIKLKCDVSAYSSKTLPTMPTFNVSLNAQSLCSSTIVDTNNSFDFMSISEQVVNDMADENGATVKPGDTNPSYYDPDGGETYYLRPDNTSSEGEGVAGVYITSGDNTNNINSGNNDSYTTTLTIPNDKEYLIKVYIKPASLGYATGEVKVVLTEGNNDYESNDLYQAALIIGSAKTYYLFKSGINSLADVSSRGDATWMSPTTEPLTVFIDGSNSGMAFGSTEVRIELLFRDPA